jgi:hypothetical protein
VDEAFIIAELFFILLHFPYVQEKYLVEWFRSGHHERKYSQKFASVIASSL